MRLDLNKKPEGEWASFNEYCGTGDGVTKEFKTPIAASEARSVLVMRSTSQFEFLAPGNRLVVLNEKDGTILSDNPDGYKLETRDADTLWIVLERPPAFGVRISVSGLGRKVGDAFKILPASKSILKKIREKQPAIYRGPTKDFKNATAQDNQEGLGLIFEFLVVEWSSVDTGDNPPACTSENKHEFLEKNDPVFYGLFVSDRAAAIRTEQTNSSSKDSSD